MPNHTLRVSKDGALSLSVRDGWWFNLDLNGEPLYLIGNVCDTCNAIFDRVRDLDLPIAPSTLSAMLGKGLDDVSKDIIRTVRPLLPRGTYLAALVETLPTYVKRTERVSSMGPHADYYWWRDLHYSRHEYAYELLLPCVAGQSLDPQRVAWYRAAMERGERPTALALSMLDHRHPGGRWSEWMLAHFLLDGHHKVMAASQLGVPITLLSFSEKTCLLTGYETMRWYTSITKRMRAGSWRASIRICNSLTFDVAASSVSHINYKQFTKAPTL